MTTKYGGWDSRKVPDQDVNRYRATFMERIRAWQDERRKRKLDEQLQEQEQEQQDNDFQQ